MANANTLTPMPPLRIDPERTGLPETGIPVRAVGADGVGWVSADIAHLKKESLIDWLRSRPNLAENTLLALLGHSR
ncbi:MAG TPA: hypothetical protein VN894_09575 [Polyangiaceae bacterium]|nr:hypothetical protein [Polyangiaceae bacterium]